MKTPTGSEISNFAEARSLPTPREIYSALFHPWPRPDRLLFRVELPFPLPSENLLIRLHWRRRRELKKHIEAVMGKLEKVESPSLPGLGECAPTIPTTYRVKPSWMEWSRLGYYKAIAADSRQRSALSRRKREAERAKGA